MFVQSFSHHLLYGHWTTGILPPSIWVYMDTPSATLNKSQMPITSKDAMEIFSKLLWLQILHVACRTKYMAHMLLATVIRLVFTGGPEQLNCIRTLPRGGMCWVVHPLWPRDFPRAKPKGHPEARGKSGGQVPNTSRLEAVYNHYLVIIPSLGCIVKSQNISLLMLREWS